MADDACTLARRDGRLKHQVPQRLTSWSGHVTSWRDAPDLRLCVIRYEDMLADLAAVLRRIGDFLALPVPAGAAAAAVEATGFARLQAQERQSGFVQRRPGVASFFRRGIAGGWRDSLSPAQVERLVADHGAVMARLGYPP